MERVSTEIHSGVVSRIRQNGTTIYMGLLFVAGYMGNAIYPSFINAITNVPELQGVSIGSLSTAEFLAFGLMILFAEKIIPAGKVRLIAGLCLLIQLAAGYAMTVIPPELLIACRLLYGAASGVILAISYIYLARTSSPGQLAATYTTCMVLLGVVWSLLAPAVIVPLLGYPAVFLFLTFFSFVALVLIRFCPQRVAELPNTTDTNARAKFKLGIPPILILCSVGLWGFFMTIFWVYADPIAQKLPGELVKNWLTISLVSQILGAACSVLLVERLPAFMVLGVGLLLSVVQIASILIGVDGTGFVIWSAIYGFWGYFLVAFYIKALTQVDPSNRSVLYFPGVQVLIASIGPMFVSQMVSETDLHAVLTIDLVAVAVSLAFLCCGVLCSKRVCVAASRSPPSRWARPK